EDFISANPFPRANEVANCGFEFTSWSDASPAGSFPEAMAFVYMAEEDPGFSASIEGLTSGAYSLSSKTRINGMGTEGISFINTGSGNTGYPAAKLGGALLALNTQGLDNLELQFTAGTVKANSREYNLSLQYRVG